MKIIENIRPRPTKQHRAERRAKGIFCSIIFWITLEWRPNEENEDLPDFGKVVFTKVPQWLDKRESEIYEYHYAFAEIMQGKAEGVYKIWFYAERDNEGGHEVMETDILRLSDLPPGSAARESAYAKPKIFEAKKGESDLPF